MSAETRTTRWVSDTDPQFRYRSTMSLRRPSGHDHRNQMCPLHNLTLLQPRIKQLVSSGQGRTMGTWFLQHTVFLFNTVKVLWQNLYCKKSYINNSDSTCCSLIAWPLYFWIWFLYFWFLNLIKLISLTWMCLYWISYNCLGYIVAMLQLPSEALVFFSFFISPILFCSQVIGDEFCSHFCCSLIIL